MKPLWRWLAATGVAALATAAAAQEQPNLKPGDKAPDFTLTASDGKQYSLKDFAGKSAVVIAWFPKAFTPGCTQECKSLTAEMGALGKYQVKVFAASTDTVEDNRRFAEQYGYTVPILSDPERKAAQAYGVLRPNGLANRWTFVVGADGTIKAIDKMVTVAAYGKDLEKMLAGLGIPKK